jgi:uncharacterized membrane protein
MNFTREQKFDRKELIPIVIIILMIFAAFAVYPAMPSRMPIHWNASGEIDGYGTRFMGVWLLPLITAAIYVLLTFMPYIAVYRKNIRAFYFYYVGFKIVFVGFMAALYIISLLPNYGIVFNMNYFMFPLLSAILFSAGMLMERSKRNFFIGFRTQWTLASDEVWDKINKLAGKGFKVISITLLLGLFIQKYALYVIIGSLLLFSVWLVIYSYILYQKIEKKDR